MEFESLLAQSQKKKKPTESKWQYFFSKNPFIFTETIPLKFDWLYSQVRLTSGPVDYMFHKSSKSPFFTTTGLIELKRPDHTIIDVYGSHIGLSRSANRAATQIKNYLHDLSQGVLITDKQTIAVGNRNLAFIIIGMTEELTRKCFQEITQRKFHSLLPAGLQILTYDYLFETLRLNTNLPLYFLIAKDIGNFEEVYIINAMEKEPLLNYFGIGLSNIHNNLSSKERRRLFAKHRETLKNAVEEFRLACNWLSKLEKRKTINEKAPSSYGLKHMAEDWANRYISNGVLIAAAIHLGFKYKTYWDSCNVHFNISSRSSELNKSRYKY
ncbi:MAG: DUF4263 domain-containing protein [Deltaproteobacteria bacterium]|nr:DUF4263 domain-containing protein [Deltaproteobacteria bacterium]